MNIKNIFHTSAWAPEIDYLSGVKSTAVNLYALIIVVFIVAGWKIGLGCILWCLVIDWIINKYTLYKFNILEKDVRKYIQSGLIPCLLYVSSDMLGKKYWIEIDTKLSMVYAELHSDFEPVIAFIPSKKHEQITKQKFKKRDDAKACYDNLISTTVTYKPTKEIFCAIREALDAIETIKMP